MNKRNNPNAVPVQQSKLKKLQSQIKELSDALKLERADAMNLRRHNEEQIASLNESAKSGVVYELLPVIDNFERAMRHVPPELAGEEYIKGVQQIAKQFDKVLSNLGLIRIETVGKEFNPLYHEAVSMDDGRGAKEIVSEELNAGYLLNGNVLRPATVRVVSR